MSYVLAVSLLALAQSAPAPEATWVQGKIREVVGPGQTRPTILTETGESLVLQADRPELQTELRRLSGVTVRLQALPRVKNSMLLVVKGYEILDVGGGLVPRIGHLARLSLPGGERLIFVGEDGQAHLLAKGWASKMSDAVGAKLWVVGTEKAGELRVRRFAILNPGPAEGETKPKNE